MKLCLGICASALTLFALTGCATKNYVRTQTAPLVDKTNNLEDRTAQNNRDIHDVDSRATAGVQNAQNSANTASQNAQTAPSSLPARRKPRPTMQCIAPIRLTLS